MNAEDLEISHVDGEEGCGFTLEVVNMGESETDDLWAVPRVHLMVHADHVHLSGLYVPLTMRRRGIATALMQRTIRYLEQLRLADVPLMLDARPYGASQRSREGLMKFYEGLGFQRWPHHPTSMVRWPRVNTERGEALRQP